jgi:hypothetical protein
VGSIPASNHGGRARILYLWWYASPGAAADQPGVQDWYIPLGVLPLALRGIGIRDLRREFYLFSNEYVFRSDQSPFAK